MLDVVMPKKSGVAAYKEMLLLKPKLKSIIISGYKEELERHRNEFAEKTVFVEKPVSPSQLIKIVRKFIDNNNS